MAIVIERTITIKEDKATLNRPIYFYVGDGDITCLFSIVELQKAARFGTINTFNIITDDISYGDACICKPDGELVATSRVDIINDQLRAVFSFTNMDQNVEAGVHLLQIHLYDVSAGDRNRFTIPPVEVNVLIPVCRTGDVPGDDPDNPGGEEPNPPANLEDYYTKIEIDGLIDSIKCNCNLSDYYTKPEVDSLIDDMTGGREIIYVTKEEYDALSDAQKADESVIYIIIDSEEQYATKSELANKADKNHAHDNYVTDQELENALANKADDPHYHDDRYSKLNHVHIQYIDENDLNAKLEAKDYATESWVQQQIGNIGTGGGGSDHIHANKAILDSITQADINKWNSNSNGSGSGGVSQEYVDAQDALKADKNHNHDEYITQNELNDALANIDPPDMNNYVTDSEMNSALLSKADKSHNHDTVYSKLNHTHSNYATTNDINTINTALSNKADKSHTHSNYAYSNHIHNEYADKSHTHSDYADINHTHSDYVTDTELSNIIDNIDLSEYAKKRDTILDTTLSMGRKAGTTIGFRSTALGYNVEAAGEYSFAEGQDTRISWVATAAHAEGIGTEAHSDYQHVQGKYNIEDSYDIYAHIVGNGTDHYNRSNAHTLDWDGNAWFAGDVTVGPNRSVLATKDYIDNVVLGDMDLSNYATKDYLNNVVLVNYATKTDLDNKANKNHDHSEYATNEFVMSTYATHSEIDLAIKANNILYYDTTTIDEMLNYKANKNHTHDDMYFDIIAFINNKADKSHTHDDYAYMIHTHSDYVTETELSNIINNIDLSEYATKTYVDNTKLKYVILTEAEYNALTTKDPNTFYCIEEE